MNTKFINTVYGTLCGSGSNESTTHRKLQALTSSVDYIMFKHQCKDIAVPTINKPHRLFTLGGAYPKALAVPLKQGEWVTLESIVNGVSESSIHLYDKKGYTLALSKASFYLTDTELLLAVQGNNIDDNIFLKIDNTLANLYDGSLLSTYTTSSNNSMANARAIFPAIISHTTLGRSVLNANSLSYTNEVLKDGDLFRFSFPVTANTLFGMVLCVDQNATTFSGAKNPVNAQGLLYVERRGGQLPVISGITSLPATVSETIPNSYVGNIVDVRVRRDDELVYVYLDDTLYGVFTVSPLLAIYPSFFIETVSSPNFITVYEKFRVPSSTVPNADYFASHNTFSTLGLNPYLSYYSDGVYHTPTATTPVSGLLYEVVLDVSRRDLVRIAGSDLIQFTSDIAPKNNRYIVPVTAMTNEVINKKYVDLFVTYGDPASARGLYFGTYNEDSIRMLTYRHYSISVDQFAVIGTELIAELERRGITNSITLADLNVDVIVREPGKRAFIEHTRDLLNVLHSFPETEVNDILSGNHGIALWDVKTLEQSPLTKVLNSCRHFEYPVDDMVNALGYDGMLLAGNSTPFKEGITVSNFKLPTAYATEDFYSHYQYNSSSKLLAHGYNPMGTEVSISPTTTAVEIVHGQPVEDIPMVALPAGTELPIDTEFVVVSNFNGSFKNVLLNGNAEIVNNKISWNTTVRPMFIIDMSTHYLKSQVFTSVTTNNSSLTFRIRDGIDNSILYFRRTLTVWANDRMLVNGVEYHMKGGIISVNVPSVVLSAGATDVTITVRMTGILEDDYVVANDIGFITPIGIQKGFGNKINVSGRYMVTSEKIYTNISDGQHGINVNALDNLTLKPYYLNVYDVPLKKSIGISYLEINKVDDTNLKSIEGYLDLAHPAPVVGYNPISSELFKLYSPFLNTVLQMSLTDPAVDTFSTSLEITQWCGQFDYLLDVDPFKYLPDALMSYVDIAPVKNTGINVPLVKSNFLKMVFITYSLGDRDGMKLSNVDQYYNEV